MVEDDSQIYSERRRSHRFLLWPGTDGLYTQEEIDAGHYYKYGRKPNAGDIKYVPQREMWNGEMTLPMMTALLLAKMYPILLMV